jgi:hypothetical protein
MEGTFPLPAPPTWEWRQIPTGRKIIMPIVRKGVIPDRRELSRYLAETIQLEVTMTVEAANQSGETWAVEEMQENLEEIRGLWSMPEVALNPETGKIENLEQLVASVGLLSWLMEQMEIEPEMFPLNLKETEPEIASWEQGMMEVSSLMPTMVDHTI